MTAMNEDRRRRQLPAPDRRTGHRRGAQSESAPTVTGLHLASLDRTVSEVQALSSPDVLVLLGEDCCWQAATEAWRQRRPSLWHAGDRRAWRSEARALQDKARRLREFGAEIGLPASDRPGLRARLGHGRR